MKEKLICSFCSKSWKRELTRGRKPILCPKCSDAHTQVSTPIQKKKTVKTKSKIIPKPQNIEDSEISNLDISAVYKTLYPKVENEQLNDQKSGSQWKCSACGFILKVYIPLSDIPIHKCRPDMVSIRLLKRIL